MLKYPRVLLLLEASREYGRGLLRGIARYSFLHGPWTMERETPFYLNQLESKQKVTDPSKWLADGIIMRDNRKIRTIVPKLIPVIFANYLEQESENISRLVTNDLNIGVLAAEHFLERGFRYFGYAGYDDMFWSQNRCDSFCKKIQTGGFDVNCFKQAPKKADCRWEQEQLILAEWLKSLQKPAAVFCCNDDRAQQVITACRIAKLNVPENIAVLGVDNDDIICTLSNPPLSSIALSLENAGYAAAQLLDQLMSGVQLPAQTILIEPLYVVIRQSSDISSIEDEDVAQAVSFIRQHSKEPIQVEDVLRVVPVSRRCLYQKFKRELNCGIYTFIKHRRIEQIERLLIETDMPISQIAMELGFTSGDHIAQFFRSEKGINPLEFRKRYSLNVK